MRGLAVTSIAALVLVACGSPQRGPADAGAPSGGGSDAGTSNIVGPPAPPELIEQRVYIDKLESKEVFDKYSKKIADERFTKMIMDVRSGEVFYFDVGVYKMHTDFVFAELYKTPVTQERLAKFNANYTPTKPEFLLTYLVHHESQDIWTLAFWEGDQLMPAHIERAMDRLRQTCWLGDKVKFRPDSTGQEQAAKNLREDIEVITNDQIYKAASYHAFTPGTSIGRLRVVDDTSHPERLTFAPEEIVILAAPLPDITVVRGIISEQFSTPLSHVALRARAWGIPHVGLKNAAEDYGHLEGLVVRFEGRPDGYELRLATTEEVASWKAAEATKRKVWMPKADLETKALVDLDGMRRTHVFAFGGKSANLGEIASAKLPGFAVPPGFGIPVYYYWQHLKRHKLDTRIEALLADEKFKTDAAYRRDQLSELRAAIVEAPLDRRLLKRVVDKAKALGFGEGVGVFVRSSTNAEDLPGFNGAGLYDTVPNVKARERLGPAIKKVWASVWNLRAYEEREHFGIDHRAVYGSVLVQVGVNATAAGVLITSNIYDASEKTTYTINAKSGLGIRVVQGEKVPEIILFNHSNLGVKVLSRSDEDTMLVFDDEGGIKEVDNPHKHEPVLTDHRAWVLVSASKAIETLFKIEQPLDIEWLFEGDTLHIVQARPYIGGGP